MKYKHSWWWRFKMTLFGRLCSECCDGRMRKLDLSAHGMSHIQYKCADCGFVEDYKAY